MSMFKAGNAFAFRRSGWAAVVAAGLGLAAVSAAWAAAQDGATIAPASRKIESKNMRLVGYNDLQHHSAYQPTIHHQGDRCIAYIGRHGGTDAIPTPINPTTSKAEPNGASLIDVTNPAKTAMHILKLTGPAKKIAGGP